MKRILNKRNFTKIGVNSMVATFITIQNIKTTTTKLWILCYYSDNEWYHILNYMSKAITRDKLKRGKQIEKFRTFRGDYQSLRKMWQRNKPAIEQNTSSCGKFGMPKLKCKPSCAFRWKVKARHLFTNCQLSKFNRKQWNSGNLNRFFVLSPNISIDSWKFWHFLLYSCVPLFSSVTIPVEKFSIWIFVQSHFNSFKSQLIATMQISILTSVFNLRAAKIYSYSFSW